MIRKEAGLGGQSSPREQGSIGLVRSGVSIEEVGVDENTYVGDRLDHALRFLGRGWAVIPLRGKIPLLKSWKEFMEEAPDADAVRKWWTSRPESNIGIITGQVSGIAVLDVDGPEGEASLKKAGIIPTDTVTVRTGKGGWHYYYRYPSAGIGNRAGILPKVDIRGQGGQVVAPPSIHPETGERYQWEEGKAPGEIDLAEFPAQIMALVREKAERPDTGGRIGATEVLNGVPEGQRDDALYRLACTVRGGGMKREYAEVLVTHAAQNCVPPYPTKDALAKVESAWKHRTEAEKRRGAAPEVFTATDLASREIAPITWVVPGILPEGLTLIAGRAKSGKSFLASQIAIAVALGRDINGFDVLAPESSEEEGGSENGEFIRIPRGVLYMDLEMGQRTIQNRLVKTLSALSTVVVKKNESGGLRISTSFQEAPSNLYFAQEWPRIGQGFEEHLEGFLDAHPDVALVVIDVFKRVKPENRSASSAYDIDYDAAAPLQAFARKRRITILMVHHTRKRQVGADSDPIEMVNGSMGLTAAVDGILVLTRQDGGMARLQAAGREVEGRDLLLKHQSKSGIWRLIGDAEELAISKERREILEALKEDGPMLPKEVAKALDKDGSTVRTLLSKLLKEGKVGKGEDGKYRADDEMKGKQPRQQD